MKTLTVPETVTLKNLTTGEPLKGPEGDVKVSFAQFIQNMLSDKKFSGDFKSIMSATKLWGVVEKAAEGDEISFEDTDWEILKGVVEKPSNGYGNAALVMQQVAFMEAVINAE